jgi:hypothetical protein
MYENFLKLCWLHYKCNILRCRWLTPVILATQEVKSIGSWFEGSLGKKIHETLSRKTPHKNRAGGVA